MLMSAIIELSIDVNDGASFDSIVGRLTEDAGWQDSGAFPGGRIALGGSTVISGVFDDERLTAVEGIDGVAAVYDDPELTPFSAARVNVDASSSKGTIQQIAQHLMEPIWDSGFQGDGVRIGICDTGIDDSIVLGIGLPPGLPSFSPSANFPAGKDVSPVPHGSMVAHDALQMARLAEVVDIGLLKLPTAGAKSGSAEWRLSVAMAAYRAEIDQFVKARRGRRPYWLVLCNSWGMRDPEVKWNVGQYATNPNHPFTRLVVEAIDRGILVVFAAGNTGGNGGKPYGNKAFSGPGRSIWGANGHPRVITVGAADWEGNWMGYSSEGPSSLAPHMVKPDICGFSQFSGYLDVSAGAPFYPDAGTSAAAPIVAGGLAVLKQKHPKLTQDVAAIVLRATADHPASLASAPAADNQYGYGIVNFVKADELLAKIYP